MIELRRPFVEIKPLNFSFIDTIEENTYPTHDSKGDLQWTLEGNSPEENQLLGIRNVQAVFLKTYPEFKKGLVFIADGTIHRFQRMRVRLFIEERWSSVAKIRPILGNRALNKRHAPYFMGSRMELLKRSFGGWGIDFFANWDDDFWYQAEDISEELEELTGKKFKRTIVRLAERYRQEHPEWFWKEQYKSGETIEYYSPEIAEFIKLDLSEKWRLPRQRKTHQTENEDIDANNELRKLLEE